MLRNGDELAEAALVIYVAGLPEVPLAGCLMEQLVFRKDLRATEIDVKENLRKRVV